MMEIKQDVCRLRQSNPCMTLEAIGSKVGLTRERVRQILKEEGLPTVAVGGWACAGCGEIISERRAKQSGYCQRCNQLTFLCEECGKEFTRSQAQVMSMAKDMGSRPRWCTNLCQGFWLGRNHGFPAHPGHRRRGPSTRKHDYEWVWKWHRVTGWGAKKLSPLLGIPIATISMILRKKRQDGD